METSVNLKYAPATLQEGSFASPSIFQPADKNSAPGVADKAPWYLRGLRPIENELDAFLKDDFVWLGY